MLGQMAHIDVRDRSHTAEKLTFKTLHDRKITSIHLNPSNPSLLLTSSLDRTWKVWDIRSFESRKEPEPLYQWDGQTKSITSAYWGPNQEILTTSYDDYVSLFKEPNASNLNPIMIPHDNFTGRWTTNFRAIWHPTAPYFIIGNMKRKLDIYSTIDGSLADSLDSEYLTAIPAMNAFNWNGSRIISGTSSGRVYIWGT